MAHHIERVNSLIRQEISELLRREVKDPRLEAFVAVTAVDTSADMRQARVYVSRIASAQDKRETLGALSSAAGYLRRSLGSRLSLRRVPELTFQWDESIERGDHLLQLIERVSADTPPAGEAPPGD